MAEPWAWKLLRALAILSRAAVIPICKMGLNNPVLYIVTVFIMVYIIPLEKAARINGEKHELPP